MRGTISPVCGIVDAMCGTVDAMSSMHQTYALSVILNSKSAVNGDRNTEPSALCSSQSLKTNYACRQKFGNEPFAQPVNGKGSDQCSLAQKRDEHGHTRRERNSTLTLLETGLYIVPLVWLLRDEAVIELSKGPRGIPDDE